MSMILFHSIPHFLSSRIQYPNRWWKRHPASTYKFGHLAVLTARKNVIWNGSIICWIVNLWTSDKCSLDKVIWWFVLHENLKNTIIARLDLLCAVQLLFRQNLAHCQSSIGGHGPGPFSYKGSRSTGLWRRYLGLAWLVCHPYLDFRQAHWRGQLHGLWCGWLARLPRPAGNEDNPGHSGPLLVWWETPADEVLAEFEQGKTLPLKIEQMWFHIQQKHSDNFYRLYPKCRKDRPNLHTGNFKQTPIIQVWTSSVCIPNVQCIQCEFQKITEQ